MILVRRNAGSWSVVCIVYGISVQKKETFLQDICLVYTYIDTKCVLLGEKIIGSVVTVKNKELVGIKCQGNRMKIKLKTCVFQRPMLRPKRRR